MSKPQPEAADPSDPFDPLAFHEALVAHGHLLPSSVEGSWGRGNVFEDILERFDALVMRCAGEDNAEAPTFPPIVARTLIERMGYLGSFPHLIGSVHSFFGTEEAALDMASRAATGQRWEHALDITEVMLLPAACYPVYPAFSGLLPGGGRTITVKGWCYRHEPSKEPTRLQSFRMREFIRMGAPAVVEQWRDDWLERARELLLGLGLPVQSDLANDPFFGRAGRMLAGNQREQRLKFELVVPVVSRDKPTAICSFNCHQDHFAQKFGIRQADGADAHTACMGFGLERVVLALLKVHGLDPLQWPTETRRLLWP